MNYYWDENLPPSLARAVSTLHQRDHPTDQVLSYRDVDWTGYSDELWIDHLIATGMDWAVITGDRMRQHREIVRRSGMTWFIFNRGWGSLDYWTKSWKTIKTWPSIVALSQERPGSIFRVAVNGRVVPEIWT